MLIYILRRLLLLPVTLFCIVLVNFIIINLAPGDPTTYVEVSSQGASLTADRAYTQTGDDRYLQFREFYGLTLPILINTWPFLSLSEVKQRLQLILTHRYPNEMTEIPIKKYNQMRTQLGDQARFIMPHLLTIINDPTLPLDLRQVATQFYVRGTKRLGFLGSNLTLHEKQWNETIIRNAELMSTLKWSLNDSPKTIQIKIAKLNQWNNTNESEYELNPTVKEKFIMVFLQTRFIKYMNRVLHLDFGTLRNDSNKTVISEVFKRFKYSLTLSIIPMLLTLCLCQIFGFIMAIYHQRWPDYTLNLLFLVLYSLPVFVVAPFLIEKVALHHCFPIIDVPIPISGFTSPERFYNQKISYQRLTDILQHIVIPLLAIMYGGLAAQTRLSRTAFLEVLHQDYVRTAWAKGLQAFPIYFKHVGRNASVTIVSSVASSLGAILGGSLFVEILFDINGFGKFFYEGVINRDYNVIMFSTLAGSFLTLTGYLLADLAYMWLDPRITLE